jgi:hypothetical protein
MTTYQEIPVDFSDGVWADVADPRDPYAHIYADDDDSGEYIVEVGRQLRTRTIQIGRYLRTETYTVITNH